MNPTGTNRRNEAIATISGVAMMAPSPAHETFPFTAGRDMRWAFLSSPYLT
jgi:hypothetical protein